MNNSRSGPTVMPDLEYLFGGLLLTDNSLTYGLGPLISLLEERGVNPEPLFNAADIPAFAIAEPTHHISLLQEIQFTELALRELAVESAGLQVGQRFHLAMYGVLGLAARSCANRKDAYRLLLSYPAMFWGMFRASAWQSTQHSVLRLDDARDLGPSARYYVERDITGATIISSEALGLDDRPQLVKFRHSRPRDIRAYLELYGCEVQFDAEANEVHYGPGFWDAPLPQADQFSRRFFENQCQTISNMLMGGVNYADIVRSRLRSRSPIPSLIALAGELHLTERTLQRRLESQGHRFSDLLREVRIERAKEYLRYSSFSRKQIAYQLGFKDPVAFSHAFKHWTGVSPRDYRNTE